MKSLLLFVFLLFVAGSSQAQAQTPSPFQPSTGIVDVLPADMHYKNTEGLVTFDVLVGAWPRPAWWGQNFSFNKAVRGSAFVAHLTTAGGQDVPLRSATVERAVWREKWQLYTVFVSVNLTHEKWPKTASLSLAGTLPSPFGKIAPDCGEIPFSLAMQRIPNGNFLPRVATPTPRPWVKSVRVIKRAAPEQDDESHYGYEAAVVFVNRILHNGNETRNLPLLLGAKGEQLHPLGAYGLNGGLGQEDVSQDVDTIELSTYRVMFDQTLFDHVPTLTIQQTFEFNKGVPLTLSIPVKRDGVLLEGEVPPRDWTLSVGTSALIAKAG